MRINAGSGSCGLVVFREGRGIALFREENEGGELRNTSSLGGCGLNKISRVRI